MRDGSVRGGRLLPCQSEGCPKHNLRTFRAEMGAEGTSGAPATPRPSSAPPRSGSAAAPAAGGGTGASPHLRRNGHARPKLIKPASPPPPALRRKHHLPFTQTARRRANRRRKPAGVSPHRTQDGRTALPPSPLPPGQAGPGSRSPPPPLAALRPEGWGRYLRASSGRGAPRAGWALLRWRRRGWISCG